MLIVSLCMAFAITACTTTPSDSGVSLSDRGLTLINEVDTLAESEDYISVLIGGNSELTDIIDDISAQDYKEPNAVLIINNADEMMLQNITLSLDNPLPEDIQAMVQGRFASALPSQITAMTGGVTAIGATSVLTHTDSFIHEGLEKVETYLYTFGNGYSFMVTFVPDDESIVGATTGIVVDEKLSNCSTAEEVTEYFKTEIGFENISVSSPVEE